MEASLLEGVHDGDLILQRVLIRVFLRIGCHVSQQCTSLNTEMFEDVRTAGRNLSDLQSIA